MKRHLVITIFFAMVSLGLPAILPGEEIELKTALFEGMFPRFYVKDVEGKKEGAGLCVDLMKAIEKHAPGLNFSYDTDQPVPWARIKLYLADNTIQAAFGISRTAEREKIYQYADIPLYPMKFVIFALMDDQKARKIRTLEDMERHGGTMLGTRGSKSIRTFQEMAAHLKIPVEVTSTPEQNIDKILAGRGSFFTHNDIDGIGVLTRMGLNARFFILPIVTAKAFHWLAFSNKVPRIIVGRVNTVLKKMRDSGELQRIYESYVK